MKALLAKDGIVVEVSDTVVMVENGGILINGVIYMESDVDLIETDVPLVAGRDIFIGGVVTPNPLFPYISKEEKLLLKVDNLIEENSILKNKVAMQDGILEEIVFVILPELMGGMM